MGWRANTLFLRVRTGDRTPFRKGVRKLWEGDSVELFFDAAPFANMNDVRGQSPETVQLIFAPPAGKFKAIPEGGTSIHRKAIRWKFEQDADGSVFTAALPLWKRIPQPPLRSTSKSTTSEPTASVWPKSP